MSKEQDMNRSPRKGVNEELGLPKVFLVQPFLFLFSSLLY